MRFQITRLVALLLFMAPLSGAGEEAPFAVRIKSLEYPRLAAMAQTTGAVILRVQIGGNGTVTNVNALSGPPALAAAAARNIRLWKFAVAGSHKAKHHSEFDFTYVFELTGVSYESRPCSGLTYEYPNRVTITSEAPHWNP